MNEYIIENLSKSEIDKVKNSPKADAIEWYPEDPFNTSNTNIVVDGTEADLEIMLTIIGRK